MPRFLNETSWRKKNSSARSVQVLRAKVSGAPSDKIKKFFCLNFKLDTINDLWGSY